jgi:hypothetical protein
MIMRKPAAVTLLSLLLLFCSCKSQAVSRYEQWQRDFSAFDTEFVRNQIDPFGRITREQWRNGIAQLRALPIDAMSNAAIAEQIEGLLARYHDGHIKMSPDGSTAEPEYLPVRFRWFPSGIYITSAVDPSLRGAKLLRLGTVQAESVLDRVASWVSIENESGLHAAASNTLWNAAALSASQIAESGKAVPMLVRLASGEEKTLELLPQPIISIHWSSPGQIPAYRQSRKPSNWLTLLPDRGLIYLRYAECHDNDLSSSLATQLESLIQNGGQRVVVDLRGNEGGDSAAFGPILKVLRTSAARKRPLVVLIDRETFSSGFRNALELRGIGGTLMGEAPSQRPVYTGNVKSFLLPYSRLQIRYTTKWSRLGPADMQQINPEILLQPTPEQYVRGDDPLLDRASSTF